MTLPIIKSYKQKKPINLLICMAINMLMFSCQTKTNKLDYSFFAKSACMFQHIFFIFDNTLLNFENYFGDNQFYVGEKMVVFFN